MQLIFAGLEHLSQFAEHLSQYLAFWFSKYPKKFKILKILPSGHFSRHSEPNLNPNSQEPIAFLFCQNYF